MNETAEEGNHTREAFEKLVGFPENAGRIKESLARQEMVEQLLEKADVKEVPKKAADESAEKPKKKKKNK